MQTALAITTLLLSLLFFWSRIRHLRFSSFSATVLSVLELLGTGLLLIALGWLGLVLFAAANLLAALVWSVVLAARQESRLVYAAIQAGESKQTMQELAAWLGGQREARAMGPIERADLIKLLAERARSIDEIRQMALPIAMLWLVHDEPLEWLVGGFDRLLRLAGESAADAMKVADSITVATQKSAWTFRQTFEALLAVHDDVAADRHAA